MNKDRDVESSPPPSPQPPEKAHGIIEFPRAESGWARLADSFKRNPNARVTTEAVDAEGKPLPDQPPAEPALAMKLKNRHLQMIAIGGSIGKLQSSLKRNDMQTHLCRDWLIRWFWVVSGNRRASLPDPRKLERAPTIDRAY